MARISDVQDPTFRGALEEIDNLIADGEYTTAARKAAETYVLLIEKRPDLAPPPPVAYSPQTSPGLPGQGTGGRLAGGGAGPGARAAGWPNQGGIRVLFDEDRRPAISYEKQRFSFSEAATYFEFLMSEAIRAQAI